MFSDPSFPFLLFKDLPSSRPLQTLTIAAYSTGAILVTTSGLQASLFRLEPMRMLNYSFRSFGFPHKQARAKLSFERVSEQQSQARGFPVLDFEAMDRDSSLPQYSIGKRGRRTQIAANVECIMKGLEILSPPIKS